MKTGIIIQARMSSKRFPNKVLTMINGKPVLQYLIEELKNCKLTEDIIVATSIEDSDDQIIEFCNKHNLKSFRGSLNNVASRFKDVLNSYGFDAFVRINADSPLLDYRLIDRAIDIFTNGNYDLVTNIFPRSFPKGQSVEVLNSKTFFDSYPSFSEEDEFEHVTTYFYKNHKIFNILNIVCEKDFSSLSLALDTPKDFELIKKIISSLKYPHWNYSINDLLEIYHKLITNNVSTV